MHLIEVPWFWWQKILCVWQRERKSVTEWLRETVEAIEFVSEGDEDYFERSKLGDELEYWCRVSTRIDCCIDEDLARRAILASIKARREIVLTLYADRYEASSAICLPIVIVWFGLYWLGKSSLENLFWEPDIRPDWRVHSWSKNSSADNPPIYICRVFKDNPNP